MSFWVRVKTLISKNNTTQEWVAGQVPVRPDTFSRWVQRKTMPNADQAVAIASALNTTVEYLVTGTTHENTENSDTRMVFDRFIDTLDDQQIIKAHKILVEVFSGGKKEASSRSLA